jgi:hypothetical protein
VYFWFLSRCDPHVISREEFTLWGRRRIRSQSNWISKKSLSASQFEVSPGKQAGLRKSTIKNSPMSWKSWCRNAGPTTLPIANSPHNPDNSVPHEWHRRVLPLTIISGPILVPCNLWFAITSSLRRNPSCRWIRHRCPNRRKFWNIQWLIVRCGTVLITSFVAKNFVNQQPSARSLHLSPGILVTWDTRLNARRLANGEHNSSGPARDVFKCTIWRPL